MFCVAMVPSPACASFLLGLFPGHLELVPATALPSPCPAPVRGCSQAPSPYSSPVFVIPAFDTHTCKHTHVLVLHTQKHTHIDTVHTSTPTILLLPFALCHEHTHMHTYI